MRIAFVTPSYRGDFERCQLLCESTSRFLPDGIEHLLLIDRRDVELFRPLESRTVRLIESESLMPSWIFRLPGVNGWWASLKTPPIRNWIYQQLLKLSAFKATDAEILQFVDSDVVLTKPFPVDYLINHGRVRLQRVDYQDEQHTQWIKVAAQLLGLRSVPSSRFNYIGNLITWKRSNVLRMLDRIRDVSGKSYAVTIARCWQFSEYMTYGVFVDNVLGVETSGHIHDATANLHLCWKYDLTTNTGLDLFFSDIGPQNFGVMIHSKYGIPVSKYRDRVESLWAST